MNSKFPSGVRAASYRYWLSAMESRWLDNSLAQVLQSTADARFRYRLSRAVLVYVSREGAGNNRA